MNVWAPLVAHEIVNVAVDTLTGSLKVMETLESTGTSVALLAGAVLSTDGAASATEGVREKSSTPRPSSEPETSESAPADPERLACRDRKARRS